MLLKPGENCYTPPPRIIRGLGAHRLMDKEDYLHMAR
ncbi:hypothetical protein SHVI106290_01580 [Shewanella violacea]|uniref:Uncharacterized protein n=1 Tax=Shewanella violacea (strain JCM 10179 / CIP 106290 / LMG 19151 / DSS12) TaxID=637905 RepID=D4ZGM1_SHEVD|nr:hypothetical protein SVI_0849 [Shewanella violacea DSS12]